MLPPGILPFWFWNTAMDPERIRSQLRALRDGGCAGAFIHPRQGFPGAYLSARWRELVALACREGAALGLAMGVCDEFPYPSGNAGGLAGLGRPERWATELDLRFRESPGGPIDWELPAGAVLACAAHPLVDGRVDWAARIDLLPALGVGFRQQTFRAAERDLSPYNRRRFFACDPAPRLEAALPPGRWLLAAAVQTVAEGRKYVGHAADTLDAEAMAAVLAATLPAYEGIPLAALFVDEIEPGAWSRHLPNLYRERTGEALEPLLPALARDDHPRARTLRATLDDLRCERFAAAFLTPLRAWCRAHGVILCEERPLHRLADAGADIPGCDPGHTRAGAPRHDLLGTEPRRNARAAAAAARGGAALCECGHSLGWGASLEDLRLIADGLLLHGITHLVTHAAFASTAALRKHDAPPSFFIQQPWWRLHRLLAERVARIQAAFSGTAAIPELLVPPGTAEDHQHRLMSGGWEWSFADGAPAVDPEALRPPRLAPWSEQPLVHRVVREGAAGAVALLVNYARVPALVRLPPGWEPLPLDGAVPERQAAGWALEPAQSLLAARAAPPPEPVPHLDIPWPARWAVRALGGNLLRLGSWILTVDGRSARVDAFPLAEQLRVGGLPLAPAIDPGFGCPVRLALPELECAYATGFRLEAPEPLHLLMEPETLVDPGWSVQVNDGPLLGTEDFAPCPGLPDEALGTDIARWLRPGPNRITVRCRSRRPDGGLRNPLYLHGEVAVWAGPRLGPPAATAPWGDAAAAGLPFACGTLEWSAEVALPPAPEAPLVALRLPHLQVDAYEVAIDEGPWQAVAWAPRRVLLPPWRAGRHRLRIRQHRPPAACFHAEGWDAAAHRTVEVAPAPGPAAGA